MAIVSAKDASRATLMRSPTSWPGATVTTFGGGGKAVQPDKLMSNARQSITAIH